MFKPLTLAAVLFALVSAHALAAQLGNTSAPPNTADATAPRTAADATDTRNEGEPIETTIGSHRVKIPEHYFSQRVRPSSSSTSRLRLAMRSLDLTPAPWQEPVRVSFAGADIVTIDVIATGGMTPDELAKIRHLTLKRIADATGAEAGPREQGESVFGLMSFRLDFERRRREVEAMEDKANSATNPTRIFRFDFDNPLRVHNLDWYFPAPQRSEAMTFIRCVSHVLDDGLRVTDGRLAVSRQRNSDELARCYHAFEMPEAKLIVYMEYGRVFLDRWQDFENKTRRLLSGSATSR